MFAYTAQAFERFCPLPDPEAPRTQTGPCSLRIAKPGPAHGLLLPAPGEAKSKGLYPDVVEVNLLKFGVIVLYPLQGFLYIC